MHLTPRNLRIALRQLAKTPGFSLTIILMLALGIGATTAMFSLIEGILLRPLAFSDPSRLVLLGDHVGNSPDAGVTAREINVYSSSTNAFSSMGAFVNTTYELSGGATPETVHAARFTAGVFSTLGIHPILGRLFTQAEEDAHQPLAVIGHSLWLNRYHRDPNVAGSSIVLDRKAYTIIGVMPRDFEFPLQSGRLDQAQVWVPMSLTPDELSDQEQGDWRYQMVARVKSGVSFTQAAQDADRVAKAIMRNFPPSMSPIHIRGDALALAEHTVQETRPLLRTLFLAVFMILLIACANVATLMLVRAIRRRREIALRLALGARARVIVRESLCEGVLLSVAGGLLGLGLAAAAIRIVLRLLPESMPRVDFISLDVTVATFALLLAVATGVLCSLAPAFAALRTNLLDVLKDGAPSGTANSSHAWLRSALVVTEIAIALVLLTISGTFLRSYQKMLAVNPGFRPDHVLIAGYQLPVGQYATHTSVDIFNRAILDRLSTKPAITAAGMANVLPATGGYGMSAYTIEGEPVANWKLKFAPFATTSGNYFRALGIPLLDGRSFTAEDGADSPLVVIVNESMAKHSWLGQRAVSKRMHVGSPQKGYPWATVVGVVADTTMGSRDEPPPDQWYCPMAQPAILYGSDASDKLAAASGGYIALRSALPPEQMIATLRSAVASVDPNLALDEVQPMSDAISNIEAPRRFNTGLIAAFALGALLLAVTGIYAVVAFSVSLRTQEIAIRMALGAERVRIARLVLISAVKLALLGCAFGVLGSLALSQLVRSFLFEVSPADPLIYLASISAMVLMTLLASALPATRAASADPVKALRSI
ncbi:MAG TPA: ABC transporter permease [Terracidiphilus sp.]|jgi:predicted permease